MNNDQLALATQWLQSGLSLPNVQRLIRKEFFLEISLADLGRLLPPPSVEAFDQLLEQKLEQRILAALSSSPPDYRTLKSLLPLLLQLRALHLAEKRIKLLKQRQQGEPPEPKLSPEEEDKLNLETVALMDEAMGLKPKTNRYWSLGPVKIQFLQNGIADAMNMPRRKLGPDELYAPAPTKPSEPHSSPPDSVESSAHGAATEVPPNPTAKNGG